MATSAAYVDFDEAAAPATPATGKVRTYAKADGLMYQKDDAGTETAMGGGGGGSVATDTIWNAKGDLAGGTGSDTAQRLAVGANGTLLVADSTQTTGLAWRVPPTGGRVVLSGGNYTGTAGTFADVTSASVTITTLARRCLVGCTVTAQVGTANDGVALDIDIDGSRQGGTNGLTGMRNASTGHRQNLSFTYMTDTLSAASHTFKLQSKRIAGSGTITIFADSTDAVLTLWVAEMMF